MTPGWSGVAARLRAAGVVHAEAEADLLHEAAPGPDDLDALVLRRCSGEPLEVVVGWALFDGLRIPVAPGVFVPRRRTEALLETADRADLTRGGAGPVTVVDVCCGTGALGTALARRLTGRGLAVRLHLSDVDSVASAWAAEVLTATGTPGAVHHGDLLSALPETLRGEVDVLLANVPYVPTADLDLLPAEARDHEPRQALDGGPDGLALLRRLVPDASAWLAAGGTLHTEVAEPQVEAAVAVVEAAGLGAEVVTDRDRDAIVVVGARHG